ncbi:MAG: hypothetical protein HY270_21230, partial [Deltaproteobacteria bacterium]|nr:hypothetical protein [Deltaproteobacteria bacterium]
RPRGRRRSWTIYLLLLVVAVAVFAVHLWMSPSQLGFTMPGIDPTRPFAIGTITAALAKLQSASAMILMLRPEQSRVAALIMAFAGLIAFARWWQGEPLALWGFAWIVVSLSPYSLLIFGPFARYMHLPLVGFGMLAADLVAFCASVLAQRRVWLKPLLLGTIAAVWLAVAVVRIGSELDGFEQRSRLTRSLLDDLQQQLPAPHSNSTIAFYRVGELRVNQGVFVFGLEDAVRLIYADDSLRVLFPVLGEGVADYHLLYADGRLRRLGLPSSS